MRRHASYVSLIPSMRFKHFPDSIYNIAYNPYPLKEHFKRLLHISLNISVLTKTARQPSMKHWLTKDLSLVRVSPSIRPFRVESADTVRVAVHCECALVAHLDALFPRPSDATLEPYIACSEPPCYGCDTFLRARAKHHDPNRKLFARQSDGRVFFPWVPPDYPNEKVIARVSKYMAADVKDALAKRSQSITGDAQSH